MPARRPVVMPPRDLEGAIAATSELCGHPLSPSAVALLAKDLEKLDRSSVLKALARCRMELHGSLNIGEILVRIDDGRPDADEAWAMLPATEANSVVWTDEMAQSWVKVQPLLQKGELVLARRLFEESYTHAVLIARCKREKVVWTPSLGSDPQEREMVLQDALEKERLPVSYVKELLPYRSLSTHSSHLLAQIRLKKIP
ncbi:hypothetical protein EDC30_11227 [Paucimonas lemoignei]|uniref:Uncharacterized protein n=1 Tax=Paucimonas lemoignei TaxID=29443 RepID=A0A4R3HQG7_PAULE|nr:hypothetical protein [Paucimonas lemoignei]TCS34697.1 hypothetical protein EDC30_11227 [Paucimonas lemoignei]